MRRKAWRRRRAAACVHSSSACSQAGAAILLASATAVPAALGVLPWLLQLGVGPSRVRRKAFFTFLEWVARGDPARGSPAVDPTQGEDEGGVLAAATLGWPYTRYAAARIGQQGAARLEKFAEPAAAEQVAVSAPWQLRAIARQANLLAVRGRCRPPPSGAERGLHVMALEVQGVGAIPPFHLVHKCGDKFAGDG
mmetsp:Transcript_9093/g.27264  ORF Transcript_9093/g.27264 Transcript_9093/m.27264 type:complete len:195 (-) Transcript_9093:73-657(-)